jgi:hypothetical protein
MVMLVAVPIGAFLAAWPAGDFRWKLPPGWSLVKIFAGGLLMGGGAILGEGCNITQGLTNSATLGRGQPRDDRVHHRRLLVHPAGALRKHLSILPVRTGGVRALEHADSRAALPL